MTYVACDLVDGDARVADDEELDEFVWSGRQELAEYVPYKFFGPVQEYLDSVLAH